MYTQYRGVQRTIPSHTFTTSTTGSAIQDNVTLCLSENTMGRKYTEVQLLFTTNFEIHGNSYAEPMSSSSLGGAKRYVRGRS